jgi:hypothetical protein
MGNFHVENKVLGLLGNLWAQNYVEKAACLTTTEVNLDLLAQTKVDLQEVVDCVDRHTVPLYHCELWVPLVFNENDLTASSLPVPEGLQEVPLLVNRVTAPSRVWHSGLDYVLAPPRVTFTRNLWEDEPLLPSLGDSGARSVTLWGYAAKFDREYLYKCFGYLLGVEMPTSQRYKDILNAIYDGMSTGVTFGVFETLVNVLLGVPTVLSDGEVVEGLKFDRYGAFVATDRNIYRVPEDATGVVTEGQRLKRGKPLYSAVKIRVDNNSVIICAPEEKFDKNLLLHVLPPHLKLLFEEQK